MCRAGPAPGSSRNRRFRRSYRSSAGLPVQQPRSLLLRGQRKKPVLMSLHQHHLILEAPFEHQHRFQQSIRSARRVRSYDDKLKLRIPHIPEEFTFSSFSASGNHSLQIYARFNSRSADFLCVKAASPR